MPTPSRTSSGGVRSLRAMFENGEPTTPELQRQTSTGDTTNSSQRPLAKVRTSFVSVEPSGSIGKGLNSTQTRETADGMSSTAAERSEGFSLNEELDGEAIRELKKTITHEGEERESRPDVVETVPDHAVETAAPTPGLRAQDKDHTSTEANDLGTKLEDMTLPDENAPTQNPDKLVSAENEKASMKPSDPIDEKAVSGDAALAPPAEALSPLTNIVNQSAEHPMTNGKDAEPPAANSEATKPSQTYAEALKSHETNGEAEKPIETNDGSAEPHETHGEAPEPSTEETTKATEQTPTKDSTAVAKPNGASAARSPASKKTPTKASRAPHRPTPISITKENSTRATPKTVKTPKSPGSALKTPTSATATTPAKPPSASKSSPTKATSSRQSLPAAQEPAKPATARTPRTSTTGRASLTAPTASSAAKVSSSKPTDPKPSTQPHQKSIKPRPRSPTRPIQLPAHLTAPTASSAAKHDPTPNGANAAPTTSLSRASSTISRKLSTLNRNRDSAKPSTNGASKPGSARPSLSAPKRSESRQSAAAAAAGVKRPESRTARASAAGAAAGGAGGAVPDGGFLARMMRPTASSASKAHEKVEIKTPPRRAASVRKPQPGAGSQGGGLSRGASVLRRKVAEGGKKVSEVNGEGAEGRQNGVVETETAGGMETDGEAKGEGERESTPAHSGEGVTAEMAQTPEFDGAVIR